MLLVTTLAALLEIGEWIRGAEEKQRLERGDYGEGVRTEILQMQIDGKESQEVEIRISPREYGQAELEELFRQAMEHLDEELPGENSGVDHVDQDLKLPDRLSGFPFIIVWELSRYDVMDMNGRINAAAIEEQDPENRGILVTVTGILRYGKEEAKYSAEVLIFSPQKKSGDIRDRVLELVNKRDEESREISYLALPQEIEGKKLRWKRGKEERAIPILLLGMTAAVLLIFLEKQKKEQDRRARREQMLLDYPEIVSQFTLLMGAGMTAKNVWKKIAEDYKKQKANSGRTRASYEEILYTWQEMNGGIPETECYERFAGRCDLPPYIKLGALLAQNQRKGTKGITEMLQMEAVQSMEERKSRARRLGEEAGMRLLAPMLLMLVVVLLIVIVPAFLSVQI